MLSALAGEEEEDRDQALARDQAAASREPSRDACGSPAQSDAGGGGQAPGAELAAGGADAGFYGCGGARLLVAVCGKQSRLPFYYQHPRRSLSRACPFAQVLPPFPGFSVEAQKPTKAHDTYHIHAPI